MKFSKIVPIILLIIQAVALGQALSGNLEQKNFINNLGIKNTLSNDDLLTLARLTLVDDSELQNLAKQKILSLSDWEKRVLEFSSQHPQETLSLIILKPESENFQKIYLTLLNHKNKSIYRTALAFADFWQKYFKNQDELPKAVKTILFTDKQYMTRYLAGEFLMSHIRRWDAELFTKILSDKMPEIKMMGVHGLGNLASLQSEEKGRVLAILKDLQNKSSEEAIKSAASYYIGKLK